MILNYEFTVGITVSKIKENDIITVETYVKKFNNKKEFCKWINNDFKFPNGEKIKFEDLENMNYNDFQVTKDKYHVIFEFYQLTKVNITEEVKTCNWGKPFLIINQNEVSK